MAEVVPEAERDRGQLQPAAAAAPVLHLLVALGDAVYTAATLTERECVGRDARRDVQLEQVVAEPRDGGRVCRACRCGTRTFRPGFPSTTTSTLPFPVEHEVDVSRPVLQPQAGAQACDRPLVLHGPDAAVRELVLGQAARERVGVRLILLDRVVAGVAGEARVAEVALRRDLSVRALVGAGPMRAVRRPPSSVLIAFSVLA